MNLIDSRVYSRKSNYKGLMDSDECQGNQINDVDKDHHKQTHYVGNSQTDSKYNKRIKTLRKSEANGNYTPQNHLRKSEEKLSPTEIVQPVVHIVQQSTQHEHTQPCFDPNLSYALPRSEQQNSIFCEKSECGRSFSNHTDVKNEMKSSSTYNHLILQDNVNINETTIGISQINDKNHLAQYFNDRLQAQRQIARAYNSHCANKVNENTKSLIGTYQPHQNDTLNGTIHQQCKQNFEKTDQDHDHE